MPIQRAKPRIADLDQTPLTSIEKADLPAGSVLQVVHGVMDTLYSYTNSTAWTWNDTGLSATITPTSTSSKIQIMYHIDQFANSSMSGGYHNGFRLMRGTTEISRGAAQGSRSRMNSMTWINTDGNSYESRNTGNFYLDSPNTTSATTYKVQTSTGYASGGNTLYINRENQNGNNSTYAVGTCNIILMEVAG